MRRLLDRGDGGAAWSLACHAQRRRLCRNNRAPCHHVSMTGAGPAIDTLSTPMCAYPLGPPIPSLEPPPVVPYDFPCAPCSYNLRGLVLSGLCPECAAPVAVSLEGRLLRHASRDFLRSVDFGLTVLLCALWLYVAMFAAATVAALLIKAQQSKEFADAVGRAIMLLP